MDSNKTQTAVEWLWGQIKPRCDFDNVPDIILEQAKELEKQQIIDAANQIIFNDEDGFGICDTITKGEQYYNETYGGTNG